MRCIDGQRGGLLGQALGVSAKELAGRQLHAHEKLEMHAR